MITATATTTAGFTFDPFDDATRRDPFPLYARARRKHPVWAPDEALPVSSFRYDDIQGVLRDPSTWSSEFSMIPLLAPADSGPSMLLRDPPAHTRLRSLVSQAFTPRMVRRLEPRIDRIARELLAPALDTGQADLIEVLAYPLPVIVIAEMLGVPAEDRAQFKAWSTALVANLGGMLLAPPPPERIAAQRQARRELLAYCTQLVEQRRTEPRDDLLSALVAAELEGSHLSAAELLNTLVLILVAGSETTTNLIGNTVLELLAHPEQLAAVRADPGLLPTAIDEVLRFSSPVQMLVRRASRPAEVRGHRLETDRILLCWIGSANRDEATFDEPERFDIRRRDNRHLAFGFGPHYCLGASLTALETQIALRVLLERTRSFRRVDDRPLPLHASIAFRGVMQLPLVMETRSCDS